MAAGPGFGTRLGTEKSREFASPVERFVVGSGPSHHAALEGGIFFDPRHWDWGMQVSCKLADRGDFFGT